MDILFVMLFFTLFAGLWLGAAYLDSRHQWQLVDWMNGQCRNPFARDSHQSSAPHDKDKTIAELRARVEVLEKLVTEPAYELNRKINQL